MVQCAKNHKKIWKSAKKLKNLQINHQKDKNRIYRKKTFKIKTKTPIFFVENKYKPLIFNGISSKFSGPHYVDWNELYKNNS